MKSTPQGWYPDPTGRFEHRFWDGARWTEHVGASGQQSVDPITAADAGGERASSAQNVPEQGTAPVPRQDHWSSSDSVGVTEAQQDVKVTAFNAKRLALEYQQENHQLTTELARVREKAQEFGALDAADRQARIEDQKQVEARLQERVAQLGQEVSQLESALIVSRDRLSLEQVGLFDFEHPAESSASLAGTLDKLRSEIRQTNKIGSAIQASMNFTFNNSTAKGKTFVKAESR